MSKLLLIANLALAPFVLCAQTAEDHFHRGAQFYVFGEKTNAVVEVVTGLQKFPDDEKLRALAEILAKEEEQEKQQQQQQDQKNEDQQKQQQDQQQANQDQKNDQEKKDQEKKDQQQAQSSGDQKEDQKGEPAQPMQAHAMTPQEAQQLLDAQKGEEQFLQLRPAEKQERRQRLLKDW